MTVKCEVCGKPEQVKVKEYRRDTQGNRFPVYQELTGVSYGELKSGFKGWICRECFDKKSKR